jgi:hypothetical protein
VASSPESETTQATAWPAFPCGFELQAALAMIAQITPPAPDITPVPAAWLRLNGCHLQTGGAARIGCYSLGKATNNTPITGGSDNAPPILKECRDDDESAAIFRIRRSVQRIERHFTAAWSMF